MEEKRKISATIIAVSKNEHGQRITTWVLTYPRMIHAEMMTHRVFSRNAASSRAIPALKMIKDVESDPFIPVAWQKNHKGMQGTEYLNEFHSGVAKREWLLARDLAADQASHMTELDVTKQLTNRLLEPFQWYTAIFTATETDNFFELRCPQYYGEYKSWKDVCEYQGKYKSDKEDYTLLDRLKVNKGKGEIHISLLAEAMWDSMNEYEPKQLKAGEWHIPFGDKMDYERLLDTRAALLGASEDDVKVKIATARCARISYNNFEGKDDYEADIKLYDMLKDSGHFSPFEHCARAMSKNEFNSNHRGDLDIDYDDLRDMGWSNNFRGFVQLRSEL